MLAPPDLEAPQHLPGFSLRLRVALRPTVYEVHGPDSPGGPEGPDAGGAPARPLGVVDVRRGWRPRLEMHGGDGDGPVVLTAAPRRVLDLAPAWDVRAADGRLLGFFRADPAASLLRPTFHVEGAGWVGRGRGPGGAGRGLSVVPRRVDDVVVATPEGAPLIRMERRLDPGERCTVQVPDPRVDHRVVVALAVGLDVVLAR